jgi:hypothetical protein
MKKPKKLERVTKEWVKDLLAEYDALWYDMPVPTGFGKSQLDFTVCFCGLFLAIETKRPDENEYLTGPQRLTAWNMLCAKGTVFVVSSREGLDALRRWMEKVHARAVAVGAIKPDDPKPVPVGSPRRRGKAGHPARDR